MLAIIKASKKIGSWRLENASLYVTLEPCAMCAGAIIQSRIKNVYYGALDLKSGAVSSIINLFEYPFNHKPNMVGGIKDEQSSQLLKDFFKKFKKIILMNHHHSIIRCESGQVLIEAAISIFIMWMMMVDGNCFFFYIIHQMIL